MNITINISERALYLLDRYKDNDCPLEVWNYSDSDGAIIIKLHALGFLFKQKVGYGITKKGEYLLELQKKGQEKTSLTMLHI